VPSLPTATHIVTARPIRWLIFLIWLGIALFLASRHVVWRDEVRALSFALSGDSTVAMLHNVHGEGHPAIWYLMLRWAHMLWPHPQVLVVVGFVVGAAAALLFAMRAPFAWPWLALALTSRVLLYEYPIVARNYGIAVLALFGLAALYRRYRDTGWVLGLLLLLLCNTNVPAVMLAGAFLLYWGLDLLEDGPPRWDARWRAWLIGAAFSLAGVVLCFVTVYPTFNDAAPAHYWHNSLGLMLLRLLPAMGKYYVSLVPREAEKAAVVILPLLIYGSLLAYWRRRPALIAAAAGLIGLLLVLALVYKGYYRHQAMIMPFLLTIAWVDRERQLESPERLDTWTHRLRIVGRICFALLFLLQLVQTIPFVTRAIRGMPESRSYELAQLLKRPDLRDAIVIGDPDFKVEVVPYYSANQICFIRERRCGPWSIFSKSSMHLMTVDEIANFARTLHDRTGKPVVILISEEPMREEQIGIADRGDYNPLLITADALRRFYAATHLLVRYPHITAGDESYDVYLYDGKPGGGPRPADVP